VTVQANHRRGQPAIFRGLTWFLAALMTAATLLAIDASAASAAAPVSLGTASDFSVLAGATVTNTGETVLAQGLGIHPGNAATGFPPGAVGGEIHLGDAVAMQAKSDLSDAFNDAATRTPFTTLAAELGGTTLTPGVYRIGAAQVTGQLTLDAQNDPRAVFIFQVESTLITASNSSVVFVNGASPCNVFWKVGSSATLGTGTSFVGNIMALASITMTTGATLQGRALAQVAAVTLDTNVITEPVCRTPTTVVLTASHTETTFGTAVTFTATPGPGVATGSVTFTSVSATGGVVTLGTAPVTDGVAVLTVPLPAFGLNTVTALYSGDATHDAATSNAVQVRVTASVGELIVNQLRFSGPGGAGDQYVELYNTGVPMPLAGFTVAWASGAVLVLPLDAPILPTGRSYLVAGAGYSLSAVAGPDISAGSVGSGGVRVAAPDETQTVTDAVGSSGAGFFSGSPLPAVSGSPTDQYAWTRLNVAGRPRNTQNNAADFALVSTTGGVVGGVQSMLGTPSPQNTGSPYQHNAALPSALLDPGVVNSAAPNQVYVVGTGGNPGTLTVRRTITNRSATAMTTARLRITSLSEANGAPKPGVAVQPANPARLRIVRPATPTSTVAVSAGGTVTVRNLSPDAPAPATPGGGLATTLTVPLPGGALGPGESVHIAITFAVDAAGSFWFGYNVDALEAGLTPTERAKFTSPSYRLRLSAPGKHAGAAGTI
jgi:hypothetical protein